MLAKLKNWFMALKLWKKIVVAYFASAFVLAALNPSDSFTNTSSDTPSSQSSSTPAPTEESNLSVSQDNAVRKALNYLDSSAFSRESLIEQLEYEGFTKSDATFGVDYINVDWMEQAALKAQDYLDTSPFSRQGLIDQLLYEGFTQEQAAFGVKQVGL